MQFLDSGSHLTKDVDSANRSIFFMNGVDVLKAKLRIVLLL